MPPLLQQAGKFLPGSVAWLAQHDSAGGDEGGDVFDVEFLEEAEAEEFGEVVYALVGFDDFFEAGEGAGELETADGLGFLACGDECREAHAGADGDEPDRFALVGFGGPAGDGRQLAGDDSEGAVADGGGEEGEEHGSAGGRLADAGQVDHEDAVVVGGEALGFGGEFFVAGVAAEEGGLVELSGSDFDAGEGPGAAGQFPGADGEVAAGLPVDFGGRGRVGLEADELGESLSACLGIGGEVGFVGKILGECEGEGVEVFVLLGEFDEELFGRFDFVFGGDFFGVELGIAGIEMVAEHTVEGLAVVLFVVVGAGVIVDMGAEVVAFAEELEDGGGGIDEGLEGVFGFEAAVVVLVVDEEGGAGGHHGGEVGVVEDGCQVAGGLFGVAEVFEVFGSGDEAGVAGHGDGESDAGVEGTDGDGLPAAAGEAGDGESLGVGVFEVEEDIEAAFHGEVEGGESAGAAEVELVHAVVLEAVGAELAHSEPFDVEGEHAAFGLVDAAKLFGLVGFAFGAMPVDVEDDRHFAFELLGFVEEGGGPESGEDFVAEFFDVVAGSAFDGVEPLDAGGGVAPLGGPAAIDDVAEDGFAEVVRLLSPLVGGGSFRHFGDAADAVELDVDEGLVGVEDGSGEDFFQIGGFGSLKKDTAQQTDHHGNHRVSCSCVSHRFPLG